MPHRPAAEVVLEHPDRVQALHEEFADRGYSGARVDEIAAKKQGIGVDEAKATEIVDAANFPADVRDQIDELAAWPSDDVDTAPAVREAR